MPDGPIDLAPAGSDLEELHDPAHDGWDELLDRTLSEDRARSVFQPIVDLRRGVPVGYEALIRFDLAALTPDRWFAAAAHRDLVPELEALSIRSAARHRADLPPNCFLTVNVEPESVLHPSIWSTLAQLGDLRGLVVEITEHREVGDYAQLEPVLDRLRGAGALIAVDDAGAGHAGLQQILALRPSFLKLDRALVEGVHRDEAKAALVEMLGTFANRIDAWLLAEGVETMDEARTPVRLGVPLVQGYLFARPAPPWAQVEPEVHAALRDVVRDDGGAGLRPLLDAAPWVRAQDPVGATSALAHDTALRWVVVLDEHDRPVGLVTAQSALRGEHLDALRANVGSAPAEVAHRLVVRDDERLLPVLVHDDAGRYVGIVPVERLLGHLADLAGR